MDCPPGFTLKRKRNKKNSSTSTSKAEKGKEESHDVGRGHLNEGLHIEMINGHAEVRGVYPIAPPNIVPPIIKNVKRKDLGVPAIHSQLFRSGPRNMPRPDVKKEVPEFNPDQPDSAPQSRIPKSLGKKYPSPAVLAAIKPQTVLGI